MLIRGKLLLVEYIEWSRKSMAEDLDSNKRSETQFLIEEWSYFICNVLMGVRIVFLPDCPLVLSLHKYRNVGAFLNQKMRNPNRKAS